jgi:hypothetical protein
MDIDLDALHRNDDAEAVSQVIVSALRESNGQGLPARGHRAPRANHQSGRRAGYDGKGNGLRCYLGTADRREHQSRQRSSSRGVRGTRRSALRRRPAVDAEVARAARSEGTATLVVQSSVPCPFMPDSTSRPRSPLRRRTHRHSCSRRQRLGIGGYENYLVVRH